MSLDRKDEFIIHCDDVGTINKIDIGHNNEGPGPSWFLDRVIIEDVKRKQIYEFPCNRWLAKDEGDHKIARFLDPVVPPPHPTVEVESK